MVLGDPVVALPLLTQAWPVRRRSCRAFEREKPLSGKGLPWLTTHVPKTGLPKPDRCEHRNSDGLAAQAIPLMTGCTEPAVAADIARWHAYQAT